MSYESARYAWTLLMLSAVNCEYHLASRNGASRPLFGPATPAQTEAVKRLAAAADLMCSLNPSQIGERDWQEELKSCRIRYDGSETATAESVTAWQVEPALPPAGVAGTVDLVQLVEGETKRQLLDPSLCRLEESEVVADWARPRFCADSLQDEYETKALLYERGVVEAIETDQIWTHEGRPVENSFFGVVKAESKGIAKKSRKAIRKLRAIWHMVPSNSLPAVILGDLDLLPNPAQWNAMHLHSLEVILITAKDRSSYFNAFVLPAAWRGGFALVGVAPAEMLSGCKLRGMVKLASRVPSMGWKSAVGLTQAGHRSMIRLAHRLVSSVAAICQEQDEFGHEVEDDDFEVLIAPFADDDQRPLEGRDSCRSSQGSEVSDCEVSSGSVSDVDELSEADQEIVFDPAIPLSREIRRDRPSPFSGDEASHSAWAAYIDDWAQKEIYDSWETAEPHVGTISDWSAAVEERYSPRQWNAPGVKAKDVNRQPVGKVLGITTHGILGRRDLPPGYATGIIV